MPLMSTLLATIVNPIFPIAAFFALIFLLGALNYLTKGKVGEALLASVLCGLCVWQVVASAPAGRPGAMSGAAVGDVRSMISAEMAYASANNGAFGSLTCLKNPESCGWPKGLPSFIDADLAALKPKYGYARSFLAGPAGHGTVDPGLATFVYIATPVTVSEEATRGFAGDHTGRVCFTTDGTAPPIVNGALAPGCTEFK